MELDLVDTIAPPVVRVMHRSEGVGQLRVVLELLRAHVPTDLVEPLGRGPGSELAHGLLQRRVQGVLVHVHARRRLIEHIVGGVVARC